MLSNWIIKHGYKYREYYREIYITGPGPRDPVDESKWITEIRIPVKRK